jgi:hypothetical protein
MESDSLGVIIEFAIGLAGFAGIAVAVGDPVQRTRAYERFQLRSLIELSFGAALVAFLALGLLQARIPEQRAWLVCSVVLIAVQAALIVSGALQGRAMAREERARLHLATFIFASIGSATSRGVQLVNVAGGFGSPQFAAVYFGLVWLLTMSGVQFLRILLARGQA